MSGLFIRRRIAWDISKRDFLYPRRSTLGDNGPINGTTDAWTINFGFTVSDTFIMSAGTTVNGLAFWGGRISCFTVVFAGVVDGKHRCRFAGEAELEGKPGASASPADRC